MAARTTNRLAISLSLAKILAAANQHPEDVAHQRKMAQTLKEYLAADPDHEKRLSEIFEEDPQMELNFQQLMSVLD